MFKTSIHISTFLLLILLMLVSTESNAQKKSYWEVNFNGGTSLFFGDIKQYQWAPVSNYENEWRFAGGLQFGRQLSYVFGVRGQALYGQVAGTKRAGKRYFQSDYIETNLNFTFNLNNLFGKKRSDRFLDFYLIGGVGITQYNTTVYELGTNKTLAMVGNGSGKGINGRTLEGILTAGLGADFRITDHFHVNLESVHRGMNSDAFDHWENGFPFDIYNYTSLGLSWRFVGKKSKAPPYDNKEPEDTFNDIEYDTIQQEEVILAEPVMPKENLDTISLLDTISIEENPVTPPVVTGTVVTLPPAKPNPEYRVQIRAKYGKAIPREKLSTKYHIPVDLIMENQHNGYYIYTVGSYATYDEARDRRNKLRNVNGIYDAFVVAFNPNGRFDKLP